MEFWLLLAGAIVLIAITLWIVWPASTAEVVGTTVQGKEVPKTMTENIGPAAVPPGDRFANQYTSATADVSAGGAAAAGVDSMYDQSGGNASPDASSHRWAPPTTGENYSSPLTSESPTRSLAQPKTIGLGAAALLSLGGAVGGAWLYARWQRQRNRPINRLRRSARDAASRLGERLPDVEDLPRGAAPMSGAATALLLAGLLASRALRRDSGDRTDEVRDQATDLFQATLGRGRKAVERGRDVADRGRGRVPSNVEPRRPAIMGVGFGGLAILLGGVYLVWRMMRGGSPPE